MCLGWFWAFMHPQTSILNCNLSLYEWSVSTIQHNWRCLQSSTFLLPSSICLTLISFLSFWRPNPSPRMKIPIYVNRWQRTEDPRRSGSRERRSRDMSADRKTKTPSPSGSITWKWFEVASKALNTGAGISYKWWIGVCLLIWKRNPILFFTSLYLW